MKLDFISWRKLAHTISLGLTLAVTGALIHPVTTFAAAPAITSPAVSSPAVSSPAITHIAVEPKGDCYIYQFAADGTTNADPGTDEVNWQGPRSVNISECAALAGAQIDRADEQARADGIGLARWDTLEIRASADGTYEVMQDGQTQVRRFWDIEARVEAAAQDIDDFWTREFESREWRYQSPRRVQSYSTRIRTACGRAPDGNAFFCRSSNSIYYDLDLLNEARDQIGDFAPATIIAHEWGHAIQSQRNLFRRGNTTLELEQQADCFAGAYTQDAGSRGFLDEGDEQEAKDLFSAITGRSRASARTHGTSRQRMAAFNTGLEGGVDACLDMLD